MWQNAALRAQDGPKRLVRASQKVQDHFWKSALFDPFANHFRSSNGPFSRHVGILHGPKRVITGSNWAKSTCLSIPSRLESTSEIWFFSPYEPWWTHRYPQACAGRAAFRLHEVTTGTGVYASCRAILRLGETQKLASCGRTKCPRKSILSHEAQDTARSPFWACLTQTVRCTFRPFVAIFGPFLGHIVELELNYGLLVMEQSRRTWSVASVSLRLTGFQDCFRPKKEVFWGTKCAALERHLQAVRTCPGAPPVSFGLKSWIWRGHHRGNTMDGLG